MKRCTWSSMGRFATEVSRHLLWCCGAESARLLTQAPNVLNAIEEGRKVAKKQIDIMLWGAWGRGKACPLVPDVHTPSGWPAVSTPVLRALAGKPGAAKKALAELDGADLALPEGGVQALMKPEPRLPADAGGNTLLCCESTLNHGSAFMEPSSGIAVLL